MAFNDPSPSSWIDRVEPLVTPKVLQEYLQYRDGGAGATWTDFVDRRCVARVTDPVAQVSSEAPQGKTEVYVEVAGTVATRCANGSPPGQADERVAATLELHRGPDGLWRVARRTY